MHNPHDPVEEYKRLEIERQIAEATAKKPRLDDKWWKRLILVIGWPIITILTIPLMILGLILLPIVALFEYIFMGKTRIWDSL